MFDSGEESGPAPESASDLSRNVFPPYAKNGGGKEIIFGVEKNLLLLHNLAIF